MKIEQKILEELIRAEAVRLLSTSKSLIKESDERTGTTLEEQGISLEDFIKVVIKLYHGGVMRRLSELDETQAYHVVDSLAAYLHGNAGDESDEMREQVKFIFGAAYPKLKEVL